MFNEKAQTEQEILADKQAKILIQYERGYASLVEAVKKNDIEKVKVFLSCKANPNIKDLSSKSKYTPLHYAVINKNFNIARLLLENKAVVDPKSLNGVTPLMKAVELGDHGMVSLLLDYKANIDTRAETTAALLDFDVKKVVSRRTCLVHDPRVPFLQTRTEIITETQVTDVTLEEDSDLLGRSALDIARAFGHTELATFLVQKGAPTASQETSNMVMKI
jgi:ankyrin repeat protein